MKQLDNLARIRKLIRKLNRKHPEYLGLIHIQIYDDCSGNFGASIENKEILRFDSLADLKRLFKEYGV